ncbi:hypothetical protein [Taklimakanibacter lacteus]|uniref:hypothetical protein n=1 Tax=Taklimakanibacter lacteus TaxID=2268456 RepID=UPI000E667C45
MLRILIPSASLLALMAFAASAEEIEVLGCAAAGVEPNCIILEAAGKTYNITAAQPTPVPGTYGRLKGTIADKMSTCQQGVIVDPATWEVEPGKQCPVETSQ